MQNLSFTLIEISAGLNIWAIRAHGAGAVRALTSKEYNVLRNENRNSQQSMPQGAGTLNSPLIEHGSFWW